ncbi:hypothetical protein D7X33_30340 [Butyricicoccus sp. 1XD8-22]|nr:hypothetical protein D7X33_30340 [Butyricicoccus sp. 1XD8-22]
MGYAFLGTIIMLIVSVLVALLIHDFYIALMLTLIFTVIYCTISGAKYVVEEVKKLIEEKNSAE